MHSLDCHLVSSADGVYVALCVSERCGSESGDN